MEETEALRGLASHWSLHGDDRLLSTLEKLHQKVICVCVSSSERLDTLSASVRAAEHALRMLNDRFASLSNSQFVERRVYDDDADIRTDTGEQTKPAAEVAKSPPPPLSMAVVALRETHCVQTLLQSDSDSDDNVCEVLKLKDMYSERPLPHLIGTQRWRAECFPESHSESEDSSSDEEYRDRHTHNTRSSLSSRSLSDEVYTQSRDVHNHSAVQEVEDERQRPSVTKFEEKQTYTQPPPAAYVPRVLVPRPEPDVFRTEPPPLPAGGGESEIEDNEEEEDDDSERKPIGGVSIFGINKPSDISAAILGRKRRDSTSGDETDDLPTDTPENNTNSHKNDIFDHLFAKSEKLQNKNVNKTQEIDKVDSKINEKVAKLDVKPKVDIFSDNIFDDIDDDDIFASAPTKITKVSENVTSKPVASDLFDDDDDLFKDIAVTKTTTNKITNKLPDLKAIDSIFDSDDELFGSTSKTQISTKPKVKEESIAAKTENITKINKQVFDRSIFDDSEDELFSDNITEIKPTNEVSIKNTLKVNLNKDINKVKETKSIFDDSDDELFTNNDRNTTNMSQNNANTTLNNTIIEKPSLFHDDTVAHDVENKPVANKSNKNTIFVPKKEVISSPNLFDDEEEMLFNESKTLKKNTLNSGEESNKNPIKDLISNNNNTFESPDVNKDPKVTEIKTFDDDVNTKNIQNSPEIRQISDNNQIIPKTGAKIQGDIFDKVEDDIFKKEISKPKTVGRPMTDEVINKSNSEEDIFDNSFDSNHQIDEPINEFCENIKVTKNNDENVEINNSDSIIQVDNKLDVIKQDVFTDIFNDIPPEFEKPKESKKSKNVNALFDDDSDDESLFFKKNDNFDDLPPEISEKSDTKNDNLFDLFLDEPPNLNVDFTQIDKKNYDNLPTNKTVTKDDKQTDKLDSRDDFISKPDLKENVVESSKVKTIGSIFENDDFDEDLFGKTQDITIKNDVKVQDTGKIKSLTDNKEILDSISNEATTDEIDNAINTEKTEAKKIGKLKPINININVNTLRPGASLKKTSEQTDGQVYTKSNEELHITKTENNSNYEDIESKLVKSVSFEGNPDPNVLDNKLSKERAKIQVKRRPSTRKARREAARMSGIQFRDDSTDNSSSIDEYNKSEGISVKNDKNEDSSRVTKDVTDFGNDPIKGEGLKDAGVDLIHNVIKVEQKSDTNEQLEDKNEVYLQSDDLNAAKASSEECGAKSEETKVVEEKDDEVEFPTKKYDENDKKSINKDIYRVIKSPTKEIKSKVIYVLNDEDIFSNSTPSDEVIKVEEETKPKVLNIIDDDDDDDGDDLFKYMETAGTGRNKPEVKIQEETKTETKKEKSLFNSDSEDDLFKEKPKTKKEVKVNKEVKTEKVNLKANKPNKSIFGDSSDSDDELFKPKSKKIVKQPTFFDSNSEDELFGKAKKETADKTCKERKRDMTVKESLFGDDGDDDLFTNKPNKGVPKTDSTDSDPLRNLTS